MAPEPVFLAHPSSLEHDPGPHPEAPARITAIAEELSQRNWLGYRPLRSPPVAREVLEAVHARDYVETIEKVSARGGGRLDLDTAMSAGSFDAAQHAAGGAVALVEMLLSGEASTGFSAHRPPGHHALAGRAMGFCLFNSIAVAAQHAVDSLGLERVLIFDWDVHHGNGTNDIFHASDQVLFVSAHQSPLYPGTGPAGDVGSGSGRGFTVNLPVPPGFDDAGYQSLVEHVVVPLAREYAPQLLLISAGYDAHRDDPLADCGVTEAGFAAMSRSLREVSRQLAAPLGGVLEGGYALGPLARSVAVTLEALAGTGDGAPAATGDGAPAGSREGPAASREGPAASLPISPVAEAARVRLARWWKL